MCTIQIHVLSVNAGYFRAIDLSHWNLPCKKKNISGNSGSRQQDLQWKRSLRICHVTSEQRCRVIGLHSHCSCKSCANMKPWHHIIHHYILQFLFAPHYQFHLKYPAVNHAQWPIILGNLAHVHHLYFSHLYFLYMCWCFKIECDTVSVLATHTQWTNTFSQSSRTFTPFPPFLRELHWLFWKQTCYFMLWTLPHFPVWPWALVEILQWHFNLIEMLATAT